MSRRICVAADFSDGETESVEGEGDSAVVVGTRISRIGHVTFQASGSIGIPQGSSELVAGGIDHERAVRHEGGVRVTGQRTVHITHSGGPLRKIGLERCELIWICENAYIGSRIVINVTIKDTGRVLPVDVADDGGGVIIVACGRLENRVPEDRSVGVGS